jgi:hypothetical protein
MAGTPDVKTAFEKTALEMYTVDEEPRSSHGYPAEVSTEGL